MHSCTHHTPNTKLNDIHVDIHIPAATTQTTHACTHVLHCLLVVYAVADFDSEFAAPKALGADVHLTDAWARLQLKLGHTTLGSS